MTLAEIRDMLVAVDPTIEHYQSTNQSRDYSVWAEYQRLNLMSDDQHSDEGWMFQVDRFTKAENDPIATAFFNVLDADSRVAVVHQVDYEPTTGWIHHIFDCEGC